MLTRGILSKCMGFVEGTRIVSINSLKLRKRSNLAREEICAVDLKRDPDWNNALPYDKIPGPNPYPIIGNKWRIMPFFGDGSVYQLHIACFNLFNAYGPIVKMVKLIGDTDVVIVFKPDDIEKLYRTEGSAPDRPTQTTLLYYKTVTRRDFFSDNEGLISVGAEAWSKFRPKVSKDVMQPKVVKLYIGPIEATAQKLVERINLIKGKNNEVPGGFIDELGKWSLESLARIAVDKQFGCLDPEPSKEAQEFINSTLAFESAMMKLELTIPVWRVISTPKWRQFVTGLNTVLRITRRQIDAVIEQGIPETNPEEWTLIQRLLVSNADDPKAVVVFAFEMFIAGLETTRSTVASMLYYLSKNQDMQEKVYQDIVTNLPSNDASLTASSLENMKYLKAFIKETLRFAAPFIGSGRVLDNDTVLGGYQVPKGTRVFFSHLVSAKSDEYFENADTFMPERWLKQKAEECSFKNIKTHPFSTLPYGFGKRSCLGRRFADLQLQIVISKILQKFKVEYDYGELEYVTLPIYSPVGDLKFKFTERI